MNTSPLRDRNVSDMQKDMASSFDFLMRNSYTPAEPDLLLEEKLPRAASPVVRLPRHTYTR